MEELKKILNLENIKVQTDETKYEKHLPYVIKNDNNIIISVGEITHPMEDNHYISHVIIMDNDKLSKYEFNPNEEIKIVYNKTRDLIIYAYCNTHGLFKIEI